MRPIYDYRTDIFLSGRQTIAIESARSCSPIFGPPGTLAKFGHQVVADAAYYQNATADRPAGYLFKTLFPAGSGRIAGAAIDGKTVVFSPRDTAWLGPRECFVATDVTFEQLAGGSYWRGLSSSSE